MHGRHDWREALICAPAVCPRQASNLRPGDYQSLGLDNSCCAPFGLCNNASERIVLRVKAGRFWAIPDHYRRMNVNCCWIKLSAHSVAPRVLKLQGGRELHRDQTRLAPRGARCSPRYR